MADLICHTLIIGAGPGGYVCAIRAGQLGLNTIIVEAKANGGTCLNVGCIPSKALIHAADVFGQAVRNNIGSELGIKAGKPRIQLKKTIAWKNGIVERLTGGVGALLKKNKVKSVFGTARFVDGKTVIVDTEDDEVRIKAENIVIATGSVARELPGLPFGGKVISSTQALDLKAVPERLAVVGAGYIGLELGTAYAKLGSMVTIIEASDRILPQYDRELTQPVLKRLEDLGVKIHVGALARALSDDGEQLVITGQSENEITIPVDTVLVAVGREPLTRGWGRESLVIDLDNGFIPVDERCATSMSGIYAIGDVTGEPMLAHRAMAQGEMVAELLVGQNRVWDRQVIPEICFTDPEIVCVGLSPIAAEQLSFETKTATFPFAANGRAMTMEEEVGFVRMVFRTDNEQILGIQATGHGVSELASGFSLAIEMGAVLTDIAATIHAHPTLGEAVQECALRGMGRALHI